MRVARLMLACLVLCIACQGCAFGGARGTTPTVTGPGYIWWEGEDAVSHNFGPPDPFLTEGQDGVCSNDAWLTLNMDAAPEEDVVASWRVRVRKADSYQFWARVGYRPWTPNEWRVDHGAWQESTDYHSFAQMVPLVINRPASWVMLGKLDLDAGTHVFQVRFAQEGRLLQGFDCFVLSSVPFTPLGKYRPDEVIPVKELLAGDPAAEWWPFQPKYHAPDEKPSLDLSFMNEDVGVHGFVTMKDGNLFFEDGTPVRFWGPNVSYHQGRQIFMTHPDADMFADLMARLGVNIVRLHVMHSTNSLIDDSYNDTQHIDREKLDRLDYLLAALRRRGIYANLDLMFHRMFKEGDNIDPELVGTERSADYNVNWAAGSAALFHPRAIELNRKLYQEVLEHKNPYTGKRWADDPALAMVTIQNEQSIFWGTTNIHKGRPRQILNQLYTTWLRKRHGTQEKLAEAWQVQGQPTPFEEGENLDSGLIQLGQVGTQSAAHQLKRGLDQVRFLYDVESGFYRDTIAAMREWGVKCPIITSNWRGAGQTTRLVLQASALGEVVDRHRYSGGHNLLANVGAGTVGAGFEQVAGRAFSVSEWNAGTAETMAEAVPVVATISAFQGWDAMFQFCAGSSTWETQMGGLTINPVHYALYPAAAMIFRRGDIRPGELVYERRRDPDFQFSFQPDDSPVPPEVLAVGRVQNRYTEGRADDLLRGDMIERLWDKQAGVVHASSGEFDWHYADRWLRLNSERTQGAVGALAGRKIECADVSIETQNPYCAVLVSALEQKPISSADRLMVSAVGRLRNLPVPPSRQGELEGRARSMPPCVMEPVRGRISVRTRNARVYAVDEQGYRVAEVAAWREGERLVFDMTGLPHVLHYEIVVR